MASAVDIAVSKLRNQIILGEIAIGERLTETSEATRLGLSRTPLREALGQLEREGLLTKLIGRGYTVRSISKEDLRSAAALRGVIEGYAAGQLATTGADAESVETIEASIAITEKAISSEKITAIQIGLYQEANELFHRTIVNACGNRLVPNMLQMVRHIPIVIPGAFALVEEHSDDEKLRLTVGHSQHVLIWDAILNRDPIRAENIMREHANAPLRYSDLFVGGAVE